MGAVKIPLFNEVYQNVDETELNDQSAVLQDGYLNELGSTVRRPGLLSQHTGSQPWRGLYWWADQGFALAVAQDGSLAKITLDYGAREFIVTDYGYTGTDGLTPLKDGTNPRASFTNDGTYAYVTTGAAICIFDPTAGAFSTLAGGTFAPSTCDDVAYIDGYILATQADSEEFQFGGPLAAGRAAWDIIDFASAIGSPDDNLAMRVINKQVYLFGATSLELWHDDGVSPFSPISGGFYEMGCIAARSVVRVGTDLYWLNHDRHIVRYAGGQFERVSSAFDKKIQNYSNVSDCIADHFEFDGTSFIVFQFISENETLVLNIKTGKWSTWGQWVEANSSYSAWPISCVAWCPGTWWGALMCGGSGANGYDDIYTLEATEYQDASADEVRLRHLSGHVSFGTNKMKRSYGMTIRIKRGTGLSTRTPQLMVRWKDDNDAWSNEYWVSLGDQGDHTLIEKIDSQGIFNTRQYEFVITDPVPAIFLDAEEDLEPVLR